MREEVLPVLPLPGLLPPGWLGRWSAEVRVEGSGVYHTCCMGGRGKTEKEKVEEGWSRLRNGRNWKRSIGKVFFNLWASSLTYKIRSSNSEPHNRRFALVMEQIRGRRQRSKGTPVPVSSGVRKMRTFFGDLGHFLKNPNHYQKGEPYMGSFEDFVVILESWVTGN